MRKSIFILLINLFFVFSVDAENKGDSLNINFTGKLITSTTCIISNNQDIVVSFGQVGVNKVSTGQYIKTVPYTLDCGSAGVANKVRLTIKAPPLPYDSSSLATSIQGLSARFLKDGVGLTLNTPFEIADWRNLPVIQVQLAKSPDVELLAGGFTATATLLADYI